VLNAAAISVDLDDRHGTRLKACVEVAAGERARCCRGLLHRASDPPSAPERGKGDLLKYDFAAVLEQHVLKDRVDLRESETRDQDRLDLPAFLGDRNVNDEHRARLIVKKNDVGDACLIALQQCGLRRIFPIEIGQVGRALHAAGARTRPKGRRTSCGRRR